MTTSLVDRFMRTSPSDTFTEAAAKRVVVANLLYSPLISIPAALMFIRGVRTADEHHGWQLYSLPLIFLYPLVCAVAYWRIFRGHAGEAEMTLTLGALGLAYMIVAIVGSSPSIIALIMILIAVPLFVFETLNRAFLVSLPLLAAAVLEAANYTGRIPVQSLDGRVRYPSLELARYLLASISLLVAHRSYYCFEGHSQKVSEVSEGLLFASVSLVGQLERFDVEGANATLDSLRALQKRLNLVLPEGSAQTGATFTTSSAAASADAERREGPSASDQHGGISGSSEGPHRQNGRASPFAHNTLFELPQDVQEQSNPLKLSFSAENSPTASRTGSATSEKSENVRASALDHSSNPGSSPRDLASMEEDELKLRLANDPVSLFAAQFAALEGLSVAFTRLTRSMPKQVVEHYNYTQATGPLNSNSAPEINAFNFLNSTGSAPAMRSTGSSTTAGWSEPPPNSTQMSALMPQPGGVGISTGGSVFPSPMLPFPGGVGGSEATGMMILPQSPPVVTHSAAAGFTYPAPANATMATPTPEPAPSSSVATVVVLRLRFEEDFGEEASVIPETFRRFATVHAAALDYGTVVNNTYTFVWTAAASTHAPEDDLALACMNFVYDISSNLQPEVGFEGVASIGEADLVASPSSSSANVARVDLATFSHAAEMEDLQQLEEYFEGRGMSVTSQRLGRGSDRAGDGACRYSFDSSEAPGDDRGASEGPPGAWRMVLVEGKAFQSAWQSRRVFATPFGSSAFLSLQRSETLSPPVPLLVGAKSTSILVIGN